jgi:predicted PurR-regulated permease PerM
MTMQASGTTNKLIILTLVLLGLYIGQHLIVPFIISVVVWYLLNSLGDLFGKIKIKKKPMPRAVQLSLGFILFIIVSFFIIQLVMSNFETFAIEYPIYHENFILLTAELSETYDIDLMHTDYFESLDLPGLLTKVVDSSLGFLTTFFLVLLYVVFLLLEQQIFHTKLRLIFKERNEYVRFLGIVRKVDQSVHSFVSIKTSLCLLSGVASYLVLIIIGVDFAFLWAFLIFLFNFIPIIGAFIGVIFPSFIALVQFGTILEPILVISLLSGIQLVVGNILEPKVLGTKLNLSPLVVVLSLTFWGSLWGIAGMFLCVPITVIMMIVFDQFEGTKKIAILLSGGKVV